MAKKRADRGIAKRMAMAKARGEPLLLPKKSKGIAPLDELPADRSCSRCNKTGHWTLDCPTSLDPTYDQVPRPNYICSICRVVGKHYRILCPNNNHPDSWTQKRVQEQAAERHANEFLDRLARCLPQSKYTAEEVALLDRCSKTIVHKKDKKMKAVDFMN
ncbi:hypothetical protein F4821DRAFT_260273 [Hypoxylon rubiginosum]|uniref:Uncharacterized protein n=1 Tax=Hypoxylon rubiginosum TaxID=110542 RepID=A0ACC0D1H5_9PEZI|nr:hypothetical protein F4821DRAFT_260273 [Hypoxylon rubiginosum]